TPQTVFSSSFSFVHIPVGVPFTVTAEEQISPPRHRAVATGTISANGEVQTLELRYVPYGNVNVHVVRVAPDGPHTPADRGGVAILNLGVYGNQFPFGYQQPIDGQGNASFTRVGGGPIRAVYGDPVNHTNYFGDGSLTVEGSTIDIVVQVFNTSTVSG